MEVLSVIVTYNPNIKRLKNNINEAKKQTSSVLIVDNGSTNIDFIEQLIDEIDLKNIELYKCESNMGIAYALNIGFKEALTRNIKWVLTLDQDSVIPEKLIATYEACVDSKIAQISCNFVESQTGNLIYKNNVAFQEISRCITSGTLVSTEAWEIVGGYDEELFLDYVDYDISMKFKRSGYSIIRCNQIYMQHELGNSQKHRFLGISVRVTDYSPMRKYYIARNIIIYIRRYCGIKDAILEILRLFRVLVYELLYEKNKREKTKSIFQGIFDGIKYENV